MDLLQKIRGDGSAAAVSADELSRLKDELAQIRSEGGSKVLELRSENEDLVYCRWAGQRADGRKKKETLGEDAKPFEGASDNRVRLADRLSRDNALICVSAAQRGLARMVQGLEGSDAAAAARLGTLVRWLVRTYWGAGWRREAKLLALWCQMDTPAAAVAYVDWEEELGLELTALDVQGLVDRFLEWAGERGMDVTEADAAQVVELATMPALRPELEEFLAGLLGVRKTTARRAAQELQDTGATTVPLPYPRRSGPCLRALRLFEDVFVRTNATDLQRAPAIFVREWYEKAEVRARAEEEGWAPEFVRGLLGDDDDSRGLEGKSTFDDEAENLDDPVELAETDPRRGKYEVVRAYTRETNADGVLGWYVVTMSGFLDVAAGRKMPLARKHGKAPFVWFGREFRTRRLMDSRGVAELTGTDQQSLKLLKDSFEDHVQVATLPPVKVPPGKPRYEILLQPLGRVQANARENVEFMRPPDYPAGADRYWEKVRRDVAEYWGEAHEGLDPAMGALIRQDMADEYMAAMGEALTIAVQLCIEFMPAEQLARIAGGFGLEQYKRGDELRNLYDFATMAFDVRELDPEHVLAKGKAVLETVRPLDARATIQTERIAARVLSAIDPSWADDAVLPPAEADEREARDERAALAAMLAGVRWAMPEAGVNGRLRLEVLLGELDVRRRNPAAFQPLAPAAQALIEERVKYLGFQAQQAQNAVTGRIGVDTRKTDAELVAAGG